jgi:hypothetical protein
MPTQEALESTALATQQSQPIAQNLTPMHMIQSAIERGASLEQINQLLDLKDRIEAADAKRAFIAAMSAFKACDIRVTKDKKNAQYGSMYTTLGNLVATVTPFLSRNNLSARWDVDQSQGIKVTCIATHAQGHSESVSMTVGPDKSGAKNPIQEIKSAITYAKACTFESVFGLASTDANVDDDGNGAGGGTPKKGLSDNDVQTHLANINNSASDAELKVMHANAFKEAEAINDWDSVAIFKAAKNVQKAKLSA